MASPSVPSEEEANAGQGWFERLVYRRIPLWVLMVVIFIGAALAIGFGAILLQPGQMGPAGKIAIGIASIPETLGKILPRKRINYYDGDYKRQPGGFRRNAAQPFVDPGYILLSTFDVAKSRSVVRLLRLSDGRVMRDYAPDIDAMNDRSRFISPLIDLKRDRNSARNPLMHPLLMPDGGLIIHDSSPLARIDSCNRTTWMVDGIFHHAVERGPDGNIWAAYRYPKSREPMVSPLFADEAVAEVSPDGRPLRLDRIADILDRNGMGHLWRGRPYSDDPFHLNDVQPVPSSGPFWQRGDVFLSLRNMSTLLLYRPSTGRVLWSRTGPWAFEHDVSVLDDHRISVFDNHWRLASPEGEVDRLNRVAVYDFATNQVSFPYARATQLHAIRTRAQGRATPLANGDLMIEETERGRLMRVSPDGVLRWQYIAADSNMRRIQLRWSRYLDPTTDGSAIHAAVTAKCT